jgi:hypothetical protein
MNPLMMMMIMMIIEYIKRYDRVCVQLHFNICKKTGKIRHQHWYDHVPKSVKTSHEGVTILWNQQCELIELFLTIN